jgi:hypothetical protein
MKDYIIKHKTKIISGILAILLIFLFYYVMGCPIRYLFGVCCPGCGMTRALYYFLRLDFATAFQMHPLIFIMPIAGVIYLSRNKLPKKALNILTVLFFALFLIVYILRISTGSDVVYYRPTDGLVYKIINYIFGGM